MKRMRTFALTALLALSLLAGCGSDPADGGSGDETKAVDLTAFFHELDTKYAWGADYFADIDDEGMEATYPGLKDYEAKQLLVKIPQMSGVVNEYVFAEYSSSEDAEAAADILRQRVKEQSEGGAWYPESMEDWGKAKVSVHDNYVALIAGGEDQADIEEAWDQLFQK